MYQADNPDFMTADRDFDSVDNFSVLMQIQKAFEAGHDINVSDLSGGQAGRLQSLEDTFKNIVFEEDAAALFKDVTKVRVKSTVLEHARINDVAGAVFYAEGGDVDNLNDSMDRKYDLVKYAGVKGSVTFQAELTQMIQDAIVTETQNKTRSLVRSLDLALSFGNASINTYEFDGIVKAVPEGSKTPSQHILDMRGQRLTDKVINRGCTVIKSWFGFKNLKLWLSLDAIENYIAEKTETRTYFVNAGGDKTVAPTDQDFSTFRVANGRGVVKEDVFLRAQTTVTNRIINEERDTFVKSHPSAPDAPTVVLDQESSSSPYSVDNGIWNVLVVPFNQFGEGMASENSITVSGGGKKIKITVTAAGTGNATLGYKIYRKPNSITDKGEYYITNYLGYKNTGSAMVIYDDNEYIPGCTWGFMYEDYPNQVYHISQLADMMKLPYGIKADKREWLQKVYLTPRYYNPERFFLLKNMGVAPWVTSP